MSYWLKLQHRFFFSFFKFCSAVVRRARYRAEEFVMTFCLLFLSESIGILFQNDDKQLHEIEKDVISIQREIHESLIAEDKEMVSGLTCYISFI